MNEMRQRALTVALGGLLAVAGGAAQAAGFAIIEQSVKGLGSAFAGGAAAAEDASTVFFNPAGMTRLDSQMIAAGHLIWPSADYSDGGSVLVTPLRTFTGSRDPGVAALVPNFYYVRGLGERLSFGLGVNAPFGLKTAYDKTWVGRYHAVTSDLKTINVNPSIAFKVNERFSLGIGLNAQYAEARLTNAVDKSTTCQGAAAAVPALGPLCTAAGLTAANVANPATDGSADMQADDWSFGYNVGLLVQASDALRLGVHYRSRINHKLKGDVDFANTADLAGIIGLIPGRAGAFTDQTASAKLDLPETLSGSFFYRLSPRYALMGDITWTRWTRFDKLQVIFDGGHPTSTTPENWRNAFRFALGLEWAQTPRLTMRAGAAYDQSPIPNPERRSPRIPGDNRTWVAIGGSYTLSERLTIDAGYTHLFVGDGNINNLDSQGHLLRGKYDNSVDILSVQAQYTF